MPLVPRTVCLGVHHDLRSVVHYGQTVVPLDHSPRARHLRALRVGHVALLLVPRGPELLLGFTQEGRDLLDLASVPLDLLRVLGSRAVFLSRVALPVSVDDPLGDTLQLFALLCQLAMRAAPLLRGIRWQ